MNIIMAGNIEGKQKIGWAAVIIGCMTALVCIVFLDLSFRANTFGRMTVFHVTGELFSVIICQVIAYSIGKATVRNKLEILVDSTRWFRIFRGLCLAFVLLMIVDAIAWMCFGNYAEETEFWMTAWYYIPMAVLCLAYAGIFRWMSVRSRRLEASFRRLMSLNVAAEIRKEEGNDAEKTAYVTVLFCQPQGLVEPSSESGDEKTVRENEEKFHRLLRVFYSQAAEICEQHGGTALEFPGYSVLCVFGAPEPLRDHESAAVSAALEIVSEMDALEALREQTGFQSIHVGIGINTGHAHVGNVGDDKQKRFTVIGSSVNLASRIGCYAKPGEILISENVRKAVRGSVGTKEVRKVMPKGFDEPISVFRVKQNGGFG